MINGEVADLHLHFMDAAPVFSQQMGHEPKAKQEENALEEPSVHSNDRVIHKEDHKGEDAESQVKP